MDQRSRDSYTAQMKKETDFLERIFSESIRNGGTVEVKAEELLNIHINRIKWSEALSQDLQDRHDEFVDKFYVELEKSDEAAYTRGFEEGERYGSYNTQAVYKFMDGIH